MGVAAGIVGSPTTAPLVDDGPAAQMAAFMNERTRYLATLQHKLQRPSTKTFNTIQTSKCPYTIISFKLTFSNYLSSSTFTSSTQ
mmetsp:Transcript_19174/g.16419  ORF Transcript_19174/g.16419 Transcript_19174/m.16419 type:complete len:85 (-) Transcript_19174:137-391(-)